VTAPDCPYPASCPVPDPASINRTKLRSVVLGEGTTLATAARRSSWPALFDSSGRGRARFSPLHVGGAPVPSVYLAGTATVALLETALHSVALDGGGVVAAAVHLEPWLVAEITMPEDIRLIDLRDAPLGHLGLDRSQLVATSSAHYPCTREWAVALRRQVIGGQPTHGLMWHSRVAEIGGAASAVLDEVGSEVCVLFGDELATNQDGWAADVRYDDLTSGPGLTHVEDIVTLLRATIA
jgi:hypothetical protein